MIIRPIVGGVEVLAPAKLNLFLEVLGRRPDGYHELETLMAAIDLHDTLTFRDDPTGQLRLECDDPSLPTNDQNLVMKAAIRLREEVGLTPGRARGVEIELKKRIPVGAGLAGGSSDAAATLVALDRLWELGLSVDRLDELAGELGSDVAFFGQDAHAAVCRGRGEKVESLDLSLTLHFVLISPPVHVSTASVYRELTPVGSPLSIEPMRQALAGGSTVELGRCLFNRLQPVAEAIHPELIRVREALEDLGPSLDGCLMSGSGSSYFGLCRDGQAALDAACRLDSLGIGRVRVVTCGDSSYSVESAT